MDDAASIRTLLHAFERGINFVDTAELYGADHSETVIGQALRQRNGKVYVATKAQSTIWPSPDDAALRFDPSSPLWGIVGTDPRQFPPISSNALVWKIVAGLIKVADAA